MKNGFKSWKCKFAEEEGYMVNQYVNGAKVASQFVRAENYDEFCKQIGCVPVESTDTSQFIPII